MWGEYKIIGKNLKPQDKEVAAAYLRSQLEKNCKPLEGEKEKTPGEAKAVELSLAHLSNELRLLGLNPPTIPSGFVHLLDNDSYKKATDNSTATACYDPRNLTLAINTSKTSDLSDIYTCSVHECAHAQSASVYVVQFNEHNGMVDGVKNSRLGYGMTHPTDPGHGHFRGFYESVIAKMQDDIARLNQAEIYRELGVTPDQLARTSSYLPEVKNLNALIAEISRAEGKGEDDVWREIKKRAITGELMHLRRVDRIFGRGSLRFLSTYRSEMLNHLVISYIHQQVKRYFTEADPAERRKIALKLMEERERLRYRRFAHI